MDLPPDVVVAKQQTSLKHSGLPKSPGPNRSLAAKPKPKLQTALWILKAASHVDMHVFRSLFICRNMAE